MSDPVNWQDLLHQAQEIISRSYSPYSSFPVAAVAVTDSGRIVRGVNVENASYGLTLCAECSLVSDLHTGGGGRLVAVVIIGADGKPLAPCGRCRQLLLEHATKEARVLTAEGPVFVASLLPGSFTAEDLAIPGQ